MELTLAPNPLHTEPQNLSINKIAILIGENGAGKSTILQSIFDTKLAKEDYDNLRVVCFSSGQNETFSKKFSHYLNNERRRGKSLSLESFYYDNSWSKLLIFLATCLRSEGMTRSFLRDKKYIDEKEVSETKKDDISSKLTIRFGVRKAIVTRVWLALEKEEQGETDTFRTTPYFRTLSSFVENNVDENYDFDKTLWKRKISLSSENIYATSFHAHKPEPDDTNPTRRSFKDDPTVSFFTQAVSTNLIDKNSLELTFKNGKPLDHLSDGEYQLLFLFALIDLFDDEETLFLLDEADSHLHYKNIERLWKILSEIKGQVVTTSHLLDSITANKFEAIKVVEKGRICDNDKLKKLINRLSILARASSVEFEVCAKISHMALLDDYNDWDIFLRLAKRKGLDASRLDSICAFKKSSGYSNENESFGEAKIQWTRNLSKVECTLSTSEIFLICDRDNAPLEIDSTTGVKVLGAQYRKQISGINWPQGVNASVYLLAWKRREIKNYLLSFTALNHCEVLEEINSDALAVANHLNQDDPADNEGIRTLDAKKIINPLINREGYGLCPEKLQAYIDLIPPEEISEDIENMYNFIVSKL